MKYRFDQIAVNITTKKKPTEQDRFNYIGLEHLDSGSLTVSRWGSDVAPKGEKLLMHKGDVLFGKRRAYQKKVAIAPFDGIFSAHGMVLRPNEEVIDKNFFPMFISSDYFLDTAIALSVGSLSPTINWRDLARQEFELPPIEKQRELANVLWSIEDTRTAYQELATATEELVKSRFIEMFGDPVLNPMGWETASIRDTSELISDGPFGSNLKSSHYVADGIRVIRLGNIGAGKFLDDDKAYISEEHYETLKKYTCHAGEIVIGTLGEPNLRACLIPEDIAISVNKSDCVHFIPKTDMLNNTYACAYLNTDGALQLAQGSLHGQTRSRIAMSQVAALPIMLPPLELQNQFADFVQLADKSKLAIQETFEKHAAIKAAIVREWLR